MVWLVIETIVIRGPTADSVVKKRKVLSIYVYICHLCNNYSFYIRRLILVQYALILCKIQNTSEEGTPVNELSTKVPVFMLRGNGSIHIYIYIYIYMLITDHHQIQW